jgi:hypothetical protein
MTKNATQGGLAKSLQSSLAVINEGVSKLAALADSSAKQAAAPVATKEVKELAATIASKLASLGYGGEHNVAANTELMARSHFDALSAAEGILSVLVPSGAKTADSPSQLGEAVGRKSVAADVKPKAYRPVRC